MQTNKIINYLYENSIEYIIHWRKHLKEYFWAIVIVLTLRANVGVFYRIPTGSMIPTFRVGDMLVANRFYTGLKVPFTDELPGWRLPAIKELEVGDVVVFIGPREENYHNILINLNENFLDLPPESLERNPKVRLLRELNQASEFKRVIYPLENNPNGSENDFKKILGTEANYIFNEFEMDEKFLSLRLHQKIFEKYKDVISKMFYIHSIQVSSSTMTYNAAEYRGLLFHVLSVPIAGVSMIMNVIIDTPMMLVYKSLINLVMGNQAQHPISFYPNGWTDQSKEYVKRLIAKGGDKVEIRNKKVYVNDQKLEWKVPFTQDPYAANFAISTENLVHSTKEENGYEHPIRLSTSLIKPYFKFNEEYWPYEPEGIVAGEFRDNFGPIVVPEGYYFMMGDNRDESLDSRYFGPVPEWAVKGTPMFIFYPWSRRGIVN